MKSQNSCQKTPAVHSLFFAWTIYMLTMAMLPPFFSCSFFSQSFLVTLRKPLLPWADKCQSQVHAPPSFQHHYVFTDFLTWIWPELQFHFFFCYNQQHTIKYCLSVSSPTVVLCKSYFRFKALWIGDTILVLCRLYFLPQTGIVTRCSDTKCLHACWERHWHVRKSKEDLRFYFLFFCFMTVLLLEAHTEILKQLFLVIQIHMGKVLKKIRKCFKCSHCLCYYGAVWYQNRHFFSTVIVRHYLYLLWGFHNIFYIDLGKI